MSSSDSAPLVTFRDKIDFAEQVSAAVRRVAPEFGLPPRPADYFVTAHAAISTGWGRKGVHGYNLTGMKAGRAWTGPTFQTPAFECVRAGTPGAYDYEGCGPGLQRVDIIATWKQFNSFDGWAREYLRTVSRPSFAASLAKLKAGSLDYMKQLGLDGWYTASPASVSDSWHSILSTLYGMELRDLNAGTSAWFWLAAAGGLVWLALR